MLTENRTVYLRVIRQGGENGENCMCPYTSDVEKRKTKTAPIRQTVPQVSGKSFLDNLRIF